MIERIDAAKKEGNTLGGIVEVICDGVPVGLGSHVSWDRKLDGRLAARDHVDSRGEGRRDRHWLRDSRRMRLRGAR